MYNSRLGLDDIFSIMSGRGPQNSQQNNQEQQKNDPYAQARNQAYSQAMTGWMDHMKQMNNPQDFINHIMSGYQQSPWAQQQQKTMMDATMASNAASGMTGSGAEKTALQKQAQAISSQDQQNWLNQNLGLNRDYISGQFGMMGMDQKEREMQQQKELQQQQIAQQMAQFQAQQDAARDASSDNKTSGLLGTGLGIGASFIPGGSLAMGAAKGAMGGGGKG